MQTTSSIAGTGAAGGRLEAAELRTIIGRALADVAPGSRVLAIVADKTRDDNTPELFPLAAQCLRAHGIARLDALVAQGTHPPMTDAEKRAKLGCGAADTPGVGEILDHRWDRADELVMLGTLDRQRVIELTGGLMNEPVDVRVNARLAAGVYDAVLVFGGTVPHEVAGFAGGAKYFFPGVSGPELTHLTHWLGALATIEQVIGRVDTPTRRVIDAAAGLVPAPAIGFTSVTTRESGGLLQTHALFAGDLIESFRRAAEVSRQVHIKYTGRTYRRVVALLDSHYDELWVGGKASYKLGAIIDEGGELIIYAPHLTRISATHGAMIEKYGYAPLERVRDMVDGSDELRANLCVAAHLAHVSYASSRGGDAPRYRITLATSLPEDVCARVHLGFLDWRAFRRDRYESDPDTLVVEDAGRDLYLPAPH